MAISRTFLTVSTRLMIGFSVSSGKVSIASTRFFTSSSALDSSALSYNSTDTEHRPSLALDRICLTPSIPSRASSIRIHTPSSTSSGAAPRYGTLMLMTGILISGNDFLGMFGSVTSPARMINPMRRFAATWLFANHAIMGFMRTTRLFLSRVLPTSPQLRC